MMKYKIEKPIRLIELFAGVGSQAMALRNIGANFEHYRVVEFDKFAIKSYNAIHGTDFEVSDITEITGEDLKIVDIEEYDYLLTYSFPCTDLSNAGKKEGMKKGSGTRSGLLWEVERLLNETENLPQILFMENVPAVANAKNIDDFKEWKSFLEEKGYVNHFAILNAKDYNVPQNRKRAFMVSFLGDYDYIFPEKEDLTTVLADLLEDKVDEKYYIDTDKADELIKKLKNKRISNTIRVGGRGSLGRHMWDLICEKIEEGAIIDDTQGFDGVRVYSDFAPTLRSSRSGLKTIERNQINQLGNISESKSFGGNPQTGRIYNPLGLSPTLNTCGGGQREPKIIEQTIVASRGRYLKELDPETLKPIARQQLEENTLGLCNTLTSVQKDNWLLEGLLLPGVQFTPLMPFIPFSYHTIYRIRKLTPLECWRLMGFSDTDFNKAQDVNSSSQLYKQAGNSIVADVLEKIFKNLL